MDEIGILVRSEMDAKGYDTMLWELEGLDGCLRGRMEGEAGDCVGAMFLHPRVISVRMLW